MKPSVLLKIMIPVTTAVIVTFGGLAQGSCEAFVQQALAMVASNCTNLPNNTACYGHTQVVANASPPVAFSQPADQAAITALQSLITTPYDPNANIWGIAVLSMQANLPGTLPGEAVTMVLLGDTQLDTNPQSSTAFRVRTGVIEPSCQQIPPSSVTLQGPQRIQVNLNINGANIGFGSSVNIRMTGSNLMQIATLDGRAIINNDLIIPTGFKRVAELDDEGMVIEDTWSEPELFSEEDIAQFELFEQLPDDIFNYPIDAPDEEEIAFLDALGFDLAAAMDPYLLDQLIEDFILAGFSPEDIAGVTADDLLDYIMANLDYFEPDEAFLAAMAASFGMDDSLLYDLASLYGLDTDSIDSLLSADSTLSTDSESSPPNESAPSNEPSDSGDQGSNEAPANTAGDQAEGGSE